MRDSILFPYISLVNYMICVLDIIRCASGGSCEPKCIVDKFVNIIVQICR